MPVAGEANVVVLEEVTKLFGDVAAVDRISLAIKKGEFFSLLGPSGCGKTTTLRLIGGFETPTSGKVYVGGQLMNDVPPYERPVTTVFQSYALFPHMNVFDNVSFGLRISKTPKDEIKQRVDAMLKLVDLSGFEKRKPKQLSGGQQQRVALVRSLVLEPMVLLLDEPLGALDLRLRKQMQVELKNLQESLKLTFLYVTHDQEEALAMSDRIGVMNQGRLEQVARAEDIYERPKTGFVAGFIGETNVLSGRIHRMEEGLPKVMEVSGLKVALPPSHHNGQPGSPISISIRPEKIYLGKVPPHMNRFKCRIVDEIYRGSSSIYVVKLADGTMLRVECQMKNTKAEFSIGDETDMGWLPENSVVLEG